MTKLEELRIKRKAAIMGVCSLGLAGLLYVGVRNIWRENIFRDTSLVENKNSAFVFKIISFLFLSVLLAMPFFFICLIQSIYYQHKMNKEKKRMRLHQQYNDMPMRRTPQSIADMSQSESFDIFETNYYYYAHNEVKGPIRIEELVLMPIAPNTPLAIGTPNNWKYAGDIVHLMETINYVQN